METTSQKRKPGASRGRPNLDLVRARMRKGIGREELGRLTGMSYKQIGLIERGISKYPLEENCLAIAEVLGEDVETLFPAAKRLRPPRTKAAA